MDPHVRDVEGGDVLSKPDEVLAQRERGIHVRERVDADGHRAQPAGNAEERGGARDAEQEHGADEPAAMPERDRKSTRLNSSHGYISYAVFCLKKKNKNKQDVQGTTIIKK